MENEKVFVVVTTCDDACSQVERVFCSMKEAQDFLEKYQGDATEAYIFPIYVGKDPKNDSLGIEYISLKNKQKYSSGPFVKLKRIF